MSDRTPPAGAPARQKPVQLLRCEPGQSFKVRFLQPTIRGMFTHFISRSLRCWGPGSCDHCKRRLRRLWKGYAAVEEWHAREREWHPQVLEVTEHMELCFRGHDLLGQVWEVRREPQKTKKPTPVEASLCRTYPGGELRELFEVAIVLQWVYGPGDYELTEENPLPAKLYLPAAKEGSAPPVNRVSNGQAEGQAEGPHRPGSNGQAEGPHRPGSNGTHKQPQR